MRQARTCAPGFCGDRARCGALSAIPDEELLQLGVDSAWGGCSVSPDGKYVVLSATEQKGKRLTRSLACMFAGRCSARLVVFDAARRRPMPLLDGPQRTRKVPFHGGARRLEPGRSVPRRRRGDGRGRTVAVVGPDQWPYRRS